MTHARAPLNSADAAIRRRKQAAPDKRRRYCGASGASNPPPHESGMRFQAHRSEAPAQRMVQPSNWSGCSSRTTVLPVRGIFARRVTFSAAHGSAFIMEGSIRTCAAALGGSRAPGRMGAAPGMGFQAQRSDPAGHWIGTIEPAPLPRCDCAKAGSAAAGAADSSTRARCLVIARRMAFPTSLHVRIAAAGWFSVSQNECVEPRDAHAKPPHDGAVSFRQAVRRSRWPHHPRSPPNGSGPRNAFPGAEVGCGGALDAEDRGPVFRSLLCERGLSEHGLCAERRRQQQGGEMCCNSAHRVSPHSIACADCGSRMVAREPK